MPYEIFARAIQGHKKFKSKIYPRKKEAYQQLGSHCGDTEIFFVSCSDPRVNPDLVFAREPGDQFVYQSIGNMLTDNTLVGIQLGVFQRGVRLVLIMGHSDCAAMKSILKPEMAAAIPGLSELLAKDSHRAHQLAKEITFCTSCEKEALQKITQENIIDQVKKARAAVLDLASAKQQRELYEQTLVVGLYYDIGGGTVTAYRDWDTDLPQWEPVEKILKQISRYAIAK